jgi:hypothetical protein
MTIPSEHHARKLVRANVNGHLVHVPDVTGLSLLNAALAYAEAGWYVLPTNPAVDIKSPGSVVGGKWHEKSSRDPEQIRRWWTANPNYGIALHCGRSGAGVFDYDMNSLEALLVMGRSDLADALRTAGAIQGTRRDGDRGHYIFLLPNDGTEYGNSAGAFTVVGEFRGKNGVIIAAPTPHKDGGHYHWAKTGTVGPMPTVLRECLSEAADCADPLTDAELDAFLDNHTGSECGRDRCRHTPNGPTEWFKAQVAKGASRHEKITAALPWAFSEAMAGCYTAREAFGTLYSAFSAEFNDDGPERVNQLGDEYMRIAKWAAAQADPDRAHRNDADDAAFWSARPELERLRTFARARCVGPWSMFAVVLARAIATIPPWVVLPPTIGSEASVNFFVALVGASGFGKNASEEAAADFLASETCVFVATPGSGEGILKQYAYKKKAEQINLRNAAMFSVGEVDTLGALGSRGGSTLMPELRKAWMGERLGFGWANVEKAVVVMGHRYRMTMIVGVQPGRAKTLLQDADGGTPQRYIWMPTNDLAAPDEPPTEPEPLRLPAWPPRNPPPQAKDGVTLKFHVGDALKLDAPVTKSELHVLPLPPTVVELIRQEQRAKLRGEVPDTKALDAHSTLARLKVAVGLMRLACRTDKVTEEDWNLAGVVMDVSSACRAEAQAALRSKDVAASQAYGRTLGEREVAKDAVVQEKTIARVADRIREKLRAKNGQAKAALRRQFGRDKEYVDEALARLVAVGDVEVKPIEYQGRSGHRVRLKEGR